MICMFFVSYLRNKIQPTVNQYPSNFNSVHILTLLSISCTVYYSMVKLVQILLVVKLCIFLIMYKKYYRAIPIHSKVVNKLTMSLNKFTNRQHQYTKHINIETKDWPLSKTNSAMIYLNHIHSKQWQRRGTCLHKWVKFNLILVFAYTNAS